MSRTVASSNLVRHPNQRGGGVTASMSVSKTDDPGSNPGRPAIANGCSSAGRAPGSGPGGRRFDPCHPHQAHVAQLDRASDYGSGGWGFESLGARQGCLAQLGERSPETREAACSTQAVATVQRKHDPGVLLQSAAEQHALIRFGSWLRFDLGGVAQSVERLLCKQRVAGSTPATSTTVTSSRGPWFGARVS